MVFTFLFFVVFLGITRSTSSSNTSLGINSTPTTGLPATSLQRLLSSATLTLQTSISSRKPTVPSICPAPCIMPQSCFVNQTKPTIHLPHHKKDLSSGAHIAIGFSVITIVLTFGTLIYMSLVKHNKMSEAVEQVFG